MTATGSRIAAAARISKKWTCRQEELHGFAAAGLEAGRAAASAANIILLYIQILSNTTHVFLYRYKIQTLYIYKS